MTIGVLECVATKNKGKEKSNLLTIGLMSINTHEEQTKMLKNEFEKLAMRNDTPIGIMMYDAIEHFYMSDNDYHIKNGGIDETKACFVKRVFGGKINTPKTIAAKLAEEAIRENRSAFTGMAYPDKKRLDEMDTLIRKHYNGILKYNM